MEQLIKLGALIVGAIIDIIKQEDDSLTDEEIHARILVELQSTKKDADAIKDRTRQIAEGREP